MAPSAIILMTLFSLAMVSCITEARMARAGESKNVVDVDVKDVAVAEAIENLMHGGESTPFSGESTRDCHTSSNYNQNDRKVFVRDFEPRPSASAYPDDAKITSYLTTFKKDFEPRPSASAYPDDAKITSYLTTFKKDFEPRPSASAYPDDAKITSYLTTFKKDFEPRLSASAYPNDAKITSYHTTFKKDFEPRPSASAYPDDAKIEG